MSDEEKFWEEILKNRFHIIPDPVPPWVLRYLNKEQLFQLAGIEVELRKNILEAQMKATTRVSEIFGVAKGKAA